MPEIERIIGSAEEEKRILGSERDAAHRGVVDVFVRRSYSANSLHSTESWGREKPMRERLSVETSRIDSESLTAPQYMHSMG